VVAKNGPKLKEAEDSGPVAPPPPGGGPFLGGGHGIVQMGLGHLTAKRMTISGFAELLSRQMDRPVLDQTELKGNYDFSLEWTPDERQRMAFPGGPGGPPPGPGGTSPGPGVGERALHVGASEGASPSGPTIFAALQEQLGLKMEAKKRSVEILVIDHVEKSPTEN
jgi:uncharacterized protein (TIGR03435 family)